MDSHVVPKLWQLLLPFKTSPPMSESRSLVGLLRPSSPHSPVGLPLKNAHGFQSLKPTSLRFSPVNCSTKTVPSTNRWSLDGATALVTGGTRGIGSHPILSLYTCTYLNIVCSRNFEIGTWVLRCAGVRLWGNWLGLERRCTRVPGTKRSWKSVWGIGKRRGLGFRARSATCRFETGVRSLWTLSRLRSMGFSTSS